MLTDETPRARVYRVLEGAGHEGLPGLVPALVMGLIAASILAMVLESVPTLAARWGVVFIGIEVIAVVVFAIEYGARLYAAAEHPPFRHLTPFEAAMAEARRPLTLLDLFTLAPLIVGAAVGVDYEYLVILRVLRFLKLARYSPGMASLVDAIVSERHALTACVVILIGAILASATAMHLAEGSVQAERFGTIPDAMWWSVVTLTTVGYGDAVPITALGRVIGGLTMVTGLLMLALPVGILASAFAREIQSHDFVVTWSMVARVPLFAGLDAAAVARVMRQLRADVVEAGQIVFRRGEAARSMYFVATGEIELDLGDGRVVIAPGGFFGEAAVFDESHRVATARALVRTRLLTLEINDLHRLMLDHDELDRRIRAAAAARVTPERLGLDGDMTIDEIVPDNDPERR